ncbi:unnamed protein product [Phytophthora fragariaefolia]|uniref:Unnamed protein product n=1 Tax=Phytophthora fragariaefolia TaxID=1490495 RepID=A0A9W6XXZ6_9STRA|nr:unnamed protein product [Phytophthora fragariaefolia]
MEHQCSVIHQLLQDIKRQDERMDNLETELDGVPPQDKRMKRQQESNEVETKLKRKRTSVTYPYSTWIVWCTQELRMWQAKISKQHIPVVKFLVAFM